MAYLYRHIRLDTKLPFYIGIGSDEKYKRAFCNSKRNIHWNNIVNKVGYRVEIMIDNLTVEEARKKEREFISIYGRKNINNGLLTNLNDGGEGNFGFKPTQEQRYKNSKSHKGKSTWNKGIPHTEEYKGKHSLVMKEKAYWKGKLLPSDIKEKISKSLVGRYKGKDSPHYGKHRSEFVKKRSSEVNIGNKYRLGKTHSEETKLKISKANIGNKNWFGKTHSEETKLKISNANKGRIAWNKGKKFSAEVRANMSLSKIGNKNRLGKKKIINN